MGLDAGGGGVDISEGPDLGGGGDDSGDLGGGGARWWVSYRVPKVCGELWKDFPNSLLFFFNFHGDVFLVSLKRRNGESGLKSLLTNA